MSPQCARLTACVAAAPAQSGRFSRTLGLAIVGGGDGFHTTMSQKYSLWSCGRLTQVAGNSQRSHGCDDIGTSCTENTSVPSTQSSNNPSRTVSAEAATTCIVTV